jgi:hypothetical protein
MTKIVHASHDSLDSVHGAEVMAAMDRFGAPDTDQNVLILIRHTGNFMRHDLPDRKNQVESTCDEMPVHLYRPRTIQTSFRLLMDERRCYFAQGRQAAPPGVVLKKRSGHACVHGCDFLIGHRSVSAGCWQHSGQARAKVVVDHPR